MIDQKIQDVLNKHLNAEFFSSYLYLSMAAYFESRNLSGMAAWMRIQSQEEYGHAMKFFDYLHGRGGAATLAKIDAPKVEWASPAAAFGAAYEHECKITGLINDLVNLAVTAKDHATHAFLQWFVTEQVEEEATALGIVEQLKLIGDHPGSLLMIDRHLGRRGTEGGQ